MVAGRGEEDDDTSMRSSCVLVGWLAVVVGCATFSNKSSEASLEDEEDDASPAIITYAENTVTVAIMGETRMPKAIGECVDGLLVPIKGPPCLPVIAQIEGHRPKPFGAAITQRRSVLHNVSGGAGAALQLVAVQVNGDRAKAEFIQEWRRTYQLELNDTPDLSKATGAFVEDVRVGAAAYLKISVRTDSRALKGSTNLPWVKLEGLLRDSQAEVSVRCVALGGRKVCENAKIWSGTSIKSVDELNDTLGRFARATEGWSDDMDQHPDGPYTVVAYTIRYPGIGIDNELSEADAGDN